MRYETRRTLAAAVAGLFLIAGCTTGQGVATRLPASPSLTAATPAPPSPTPQAPAPSTAILASGTLAPGTYFIGDRCCVGPKGLYLTVPAGWETFDPVLVGKHLDPEKVYGVMLEAHLVGNVYAEPCHRVGGALNPAVGPTVDDLVNALAEQAGPNGSPVTDVTLAGYPAKQIVLTMPPGLDIATCADESYSYWHHASDPNGWGPRIFFKPRIVTVYVLDVGGTRQVLASSYLPDATAADRTELEQVVASVRFEP